ncbi:hypothetical protein [Streptomyces rishiriensis]|uniref:Deacetylase sirtuin-type domain-containing protein n=1 Tax=Streptomyces rishiriensis TaxID=68264 RepID=A0ABU0NGS6_STRRH|nr:hypothetical protein [Streptomyces rishiriensis]MDQ0578304.1 hypothetical protein [Streptomyces rishiriensis]
MFLPYPVIEQLDDTQVATWEKHFAGAKHERPRAIEEGIWRRTQDPANAVQSGWSEDEQGRRRIVHYRYRFDLDYTFPVPRLVLSDLYLYASVLAPKAEIGEYRDNVRSWLAKGGWRQVDDTMWSKGDLRVTVNPYDTHPQDERASRETPAGFCSLDVVFVSEDFAVTRNVRQMPWNVLAGGIRIKDERGNPTYADDLSELKNYLPFQVEIGCGTSVEAGVPPLHFLHQAYRVTERTDNVMKQTHPFVLSPQKDTLVREMLLDATAKADELVTMFRVSFLAEPTAAHHALKALHDAGAFVGPVMQHNFDLLAARTGLAEHFVRRYDQKIPPVPFHPEAKALLVIGLHADRRSVQKRARERGMKVFYIDTEGLEEFGTYMPYPLEGPQDGDVIVKAEAIPTLIELCHHLGVNVPVTQAAA